MRIILLLFLFLSTYSFAQKDSTTKVSFICMSNIGILYPDFTFPEYSSNSNGYSYFVVSPKLGFNTNLLAGVSTNIFKSCNLENVLGIGYSKNNYMKSGFRVSYGGIAGLDTFNGIIKESNIENSIVLMNGLLFYNPDKKKNKLYFSNYITSSMIYNKILVSETSDEIDHTKGKSKLHTKYLKFIFNSTHIVSYSMKFNSNEFKIGAGFNIIFFKPQKGYINPLINLTLLL